MKLMNVSAVIVLSGLFSIAFATTTTTVVSVPNGEVTIEADCTGGEILKVTRKIGAGVMTQNLGCGAKGSMN